MRAEITRVCVFCKEPIRIEPDNDTYIYDKKSLGGYAHKKCFIEKKTSLKRKKWSLEQCNEWIEAASKNTKAMLNQRYLTDWIFKTYGITYLPPQFYNKLAKIINGSYEKVSKPVPAEDLIDMWQRKIGYLNKVANFNREKGKVLDGVGRVNYDLGILLSRYDSYLKWKEEVEAENKKVVQSIREMKDKVDYSVIPTISKRPSKTDSINVSNIIDEI